MSDQVPAVSAAQQNGRQARFQQLVMAVLDADLPRGEELDYWEPDKLSARHLQILTMKAAGFSHKVISQQMNVSESRISVIVNHPDAKHILAAMIGLAADQLVDINTQMKAYSQEVLPSLMSDFRAAEGSGLDGIKVRASLGFGILDRAGFGPTRKVEAKVEHSLTLPAGEAARLADVLEEAEDVEYEIQDEQTVAAGSGTGLPDQSQAVSVPVAVSRPPAGDSPAPSAERAA